MNRKFGWSFLGLLFLAIGCARVQVQAPKDPIKMDITMRLDVYQHVSNDIDAIEKIVSGQDNKMNLSNAILPSAHAAEGLSPEAEQAAYRRRDRLAEVTGLKNQGILKESASALLVAGAGGDAHSSQVMSDENGDRLIIYKAITEKNQSTLEDVQKIYAERLSH